MESTDVLRIIQQHIQFIKELLPYAKQEFIAYIQKLYHIIHQKLSENTDIKNNLEQKLNLQKQNEIKHLEEFQKLNQFYQMELNFNNELIIRNCSLIIQQQQQHYKLITKENKNRLNNRKQELYEKIIKPLNEKLEQTRINNMEKEKLRRIYWGQMKFKLSCILLKYDSEMLELQNRLEFITNIQENEEKELLNYKTLYLSQDKQYHKLMKEKQDYLENERQKKLNEFRIKLAKRTIVKFVEEHYPIWKKKKLKSVKKKINKSRFNTR